MAISHCNVTLHVAVGSNGPGVNFTFDSPNGATCARTCEGDNGNVTYAPFMRFPHTHHFYYRLKLSDFANNWRHRLSVAVAAGFNTSADQGWHLSYGSCFPLPDSCRQHCDRVESLTHSGDTWSHRHHMEIVQCRVPCAACGDLPVIPSFNTRAGLPSVKMENTGNGQGVDTNNFYACPGENIYREPISCTGGVCTGALLYWLIIGAAGMLLVLCIAWCMYQRCCRRRCCKKGAPLKERLLMPNSANSGDPVRRLPGLTFVTYRLALPTLHRPVKMLSQFSIDRVFAEKLVTDYEARRKKTKNYKANRACRL